MACLSGASTPPQGPGRRSPFAEFGVPQTRSPPPEPRHSDSAEAMRKLEATVAQLQKWVQAQAKRIDEIEGQVREQTKEATEYARAKCTESDARIRADLDENIPKMLASLETKIFAPIPGIVETRVKELEDKVKERTDGLEQAVKGIDQAFKAHMLVTEQHQAYLKAQFDAKPGEEQTLFSHFKYLEAEIGKMSAIPRHDGSMGQKAADEVKSMLQDLETHVTKKQDDKLSHVGVVMSQQQDRVDERFKSIESEIMFLKADVAAASPVLVRTPPGYGGQEGHSVHPPPAPHSEARGAHRAGGFPIGGGMRDAYGGSGGGSADPRGVFEGAPGDRRGGQDRENHGAHRDCGKFCDGAPKDRQEAGF